MIYRFSSPKLTIFCLLGTMVLVFLGTLEQISVGIQAAQEKFFRSLFIYWQPEASPIKIPVFPGGYCFAILLLLNLGTAYIYRFKITWQKAGILAIHFGLILLILGEIVTGIFAVESQMTLRVGDISNYSESLYTKELVIIDTSNPDYDHVVSIPEKKLKVGKDLSLPTLPFNLCTKAIYPHARLSMPSEELTNAENHGAGTKIKVESLPPLNQDGKINTFAAFIELKDEKESIGSWLLSNGIPFFQSFHYKGKSYDLAIRRKRYYYPFSLQLTNFIHETYPGTNVPENFCSSVKLYGEGGNFDRSTTIYMNHPLRYGGKNFYQASYGENDALSVFQVVDNPGRVIPYLSSGLVAAGLLMQFLLSLYRFKSKKGA